MLAPVVRRTYAPRGKTPIRKAWDRRDRISAISAVSISPRYHRLNLHALFLANNQNVQARDTVEFLKLLHAHIPGPLTILWDRGTVHDRSTEVRAWLTKHPKIVTEKFPAYAPELNPDEQVWTSTKYGRMANFAPRNTSELRIRMHAEFERLRGRQDLLVSCVQHSGLPLLE
jgi:transposase